MATRYNNRKIIISESTQKIATSFVIPGMILTFNYAEKGVLDTRPLLLFLYENEKRKSIEGLNLNYVNPAKIDYLFNRIDKLKIYTVMENLVGLKNDYSRIFLTTRFKRRPKGGKYFYKEIIKTEKELQKAYRNYKLDKLSSLGIVNLKKEYITDMSDEAGIQRPGKDYSRTDEDHDGRHQH